MINIDLFGAFSSWKMLKLFLLPEFSDNLLLTDFMIYLKTLDKSLEYS